MQENMRFAVERIAYSGRLAAHWGASAADKVVGSQPAGGNTPCSANWALEIGSPIQAWDGAGTAPSALSSCFDAGNYEPNTDVIAVRYIDSDPLEPAAPLESNQRYVTVQTQANRAQFHLGSAGYPVFPDLNLGGRRDDATGDVLDPQTRTYQYVVELFWIRRCNDPGVDGACGNGDDGDADAPVPTLMRGFFDSDGNWMSEPMVDGAEQLQVEFQTERGAWVNATDVAASGLPWRAYTGMRVAGISRSGQRDNGFPEDTRTFSLSQDTPSHTAAANASKFLRTRYESTVSLRNLFRPLATDA
jgi:hypothetical protein